MQMSLFQQTRVGQGFFAPAGGFPQAVDGRWGAPCKALPREPHRSAAGSGVQSGQTRPRSALPGD